MKKLRITALLASGLLTLSFAGTASAMAVGPLVAPIAHLAANITSCPAGTTVLVDGPTGSQTSGSSSAGGITVDVTYSAGQTTVAFVVSGGVVEVAYIKGGNNYNEYNYTSLGGVSADSGLVSPLNGGGNVPVVSHSVFCVAATTTTTTTTSSETTSDTTSSTTSTETTTQSTTSSETTSDTTSTDTTTSDTTSSDTTSSDTTSSDTTSSDTTTSDTTSSDTTTSDTTQSSTTSSETTGSSTTSTSTPSGSVAGETGTPQITPPSTDTIGSQPGTANTGSWMLLMAAGTIASLAVLVLAPARKRR